MGGLSVSAGSNRTNTSLSNTLLGSQRSSVATKASTKKSTGGTTGATPSNATTAPTSNEVTSANATARSTDYASGTTYENASGASTKQANETATTHETGTITTDHMDPATRAAYAQLLAQLQGGGTAAQQQGTAALQALLANSQANAAGYSQDAARQQAQQSMAVYSQQLREQILPQLNASMEAAGLSGDSMNALLAQDAASRQAAQAANLEATLITQYGELANAQQRLGLDAATGLRTDPVAAQLATLLETGTGGFTTETRNLTTQGTTQGTEATVEQRNTAGGSTTTGSKEETRTSAGTGSTYDALGLLNAQSTAAQASGSSGNSSFDKIKSLVALQSIMPDGQNILGSLGILSSGTKGEQGALALGRGGPTTVQSSALSGLLNELGIGIR